MHVVMLSLMVSLAVCLLLLLGFGLFTRSSAAHRIGGDEPRRSDPRDELTKQPQLPARR
jgi:hypothetical protein